MSRRPAVSAHRGGREHAPAQSWAAFSSAIAMGVDYIEFDVRRSADGRFVAHHDDRIGPSGPLVGERTYAELCLLAGYEIPLVLDVVAMTRGRCVAHLDLKDVGHEHDVVKNALDIVGPDGVVVSTLNEASLRAVRELDPTVRTALSLGQGLPGRGRPRSRPRPRKDCSLRRIVASGCDWVVLNHWLLTGGLLRNCAARGIGVMVWTVNDARRVRDYLTDDRIGVVITDRPGQALAIRAELP